MRILHKRTSLKDQLKEVLAPIRLHQHPRIIILLLLWNHCWVVVQLVKHCWRLWGCAAEVGNLILKPPIA
jgi:hypothetical protein